MTTVTITRTVISDADRLLLHTARRLSLDAGNVSASVVTHTYQTDCPIPALVAMLELIAW